MERLTYRVNDGGIFVKESDVKTFEVEDVVMHTGNAIRKLAEYEDLEEQGKLLKLPCTVGDTIYEIYSDNIKEHKVDEVSTHSIWIDNMYFDHADIGQNIFLTKDEAEAALKGMEVMKEVENNNGV